MTMVGALSCQTNLQKSTTVFGRGPESERIRERERKGEKGGGKERARGSFCTVDTAGHTHAQVHKRNAGIENIFHTLSGKELVWLGVTLYET